MTVYLIVVAYMLTCPYKQRKYLRKFERMESAFLKIRITTDDEENVQELCNRSVTWAYIRDGSLEGFLPDPVNFHVYLETYLKPQNIRDLIRRKVGNGNANYYLSYMVISRHTFRHYNIAPETLEKASTMKMHKTCQVGRARRVQSVIA